MMLADYPIGGFLVAVADSEFSLPFQIVGVFHLLLFFLGLSQNIRTCIWYQILVGVALLSLPLLLAIGVYFAMQPVA